MWLVEFRGYKSEAPEASYNHLITCKDELQGDCSLFTLLLSVVVADDTVKAAGDAGSGAASAAGNAAGGIADTAKGALGGVLLVGGLVGSLTGAARAATGAAIGSNYL
ncbi:hypothetical protein L596_009071 [Steinernema carpocapsae]|uniref:Uncharacterized protein n=1 Tax=Steinernema carpocapsae TaxID=34508 RepID=A0A4U5PEP4_STECR|nr:hypothetical protein L596_009071 [Steinernema carpocapsae]